MTSTSLDDIHILIENNMILQKDGNYAPPSKQHTVVVIDDLNMSKMSKEYDV
jgi:hypothetical protein